MRRLDRTVTEVFLHPEHVDPRFGDRETNGNVFAWNLPVLAADVAWNQNVRAQLYFVAGDAEGGANLERKLTILWWPDAETQQFNIARIRRSESNEI